MNFGLSEEQKILRDSVRKFAEKQIAPIINELDEKEEFSVDIFKGMADLGLLGIAIPGRYGGAEMDYLSYIIAVEELARVDASQSVTIAAANSLAIGPVFYFGNDDQKKTYLPKLCSGEMLGSFGLTEPNAGSDASASKTTAKLKNGNWVINGSKIFITNSATTIPGFCIIQSVTDIKPNSQKELSCIIVPTDTKGFVANSMHKKMMWRSSNTGELFLDNCEVPEENLLGRIGEGLHYMLKTLDNGRLAIAAMGVGGAQGAFEMALKYANERKQFGKSIASFQAVSFMLADMATEIEASRALLYKACNLKDQNLPFQKQAAMAKLYCSEMFGRVVDKAVQIHGGYGLMKEYQVERFYRDQKVLTIGEGTSEIQRYVIARKIGCSKK